MSCEVLLGACDSSTLSGYMKGMGAFRVLAEQFDTELRLYWRDNIPHLVFSRPTCKEELLRFFFNRYEPTPIVISWSGKDFFKVSRGGVLKASSKPPTENGIVEAFLFSRSPRLQTYRSAISQTIGVIDGLKLTKEKITGPKNTKVKAKFMSLLRSTLPDEMVEFMDVAAIIGEDRFVPNSLLGSGGGSDGRLHFGGNYMQCLWLCLPDFDDQRDLKGNYRGFDSLASCEQSLFGGVRGKVVAVVDDSPGLFSPGGVGGPNAFEGFEGKALRSPWEFVFIMEGLPLFSGALSRRSGSRGAGLRRQAASFPFTCKVSYSNATSILPKETGNQEIWLPLWHNPASLKSIKTVLSEGRAEISGRQARDGLGFVRAVASLGIDRGISEFRHYGLVRGRVGGENYHTTVDLGSMTTFAKPLENIRLFDELDGWLQRLRRACKNKTFAYRYEKHLRSIEGSIIDYCMHGGVHGLQRVLMSLGRAERGFSFAGEARPVSPLYISPRWILACDDGSMEYRIACALASIYDEHVGPVRAQMEPVEWDKRLYAGWKANRMDVSWRKGSLSDSLREILLRRLMDGVRTESEFLPIRGRISASLADVHRYLNGYGDESKLSDLLWALSTVRWWEYRRESDAPDWPFERAPELSRLYSLLKLVHLPGNLLFRSDNLGGRWELSWDPEGGTRIPPVPEVIRLVQDGRISAAVEKTVHRLRASSLTPLGTIRGRASIPDLIVRETEKSRLAGALLIPVWEIDSLARASLRTPSQG